MNKIYSLRYSPVHKSLIAVSELCSRRTRGSSSGRMTRLLGISVIAAISVGAASPAFALPTGGKVVAGQISIQQTSTTNLNVVQSTQKGIVNWQSFGIKANQNVNFVQPGASSVTLNRVTGGNPSAIYGHLNANGQVFLVNPNGILFAPGASVNVGGIVASTLGIDNQSFLSGTYHFSGGGNGDVTNQGTITAARGGYIALIGPRVNNDGLIRAPQGSVDLGAGSAVDLTLSNNRLMSFQVSRAVLNAAVNNGGAIRAKGGQIILSARSKNTILRTVVNTTGIIVADSAVNKGGTITLLGGVMGAVQVSGRVSASSQKATGGTISITGKNVEIGAGTQINATGGSGGGNINVGGNLRGGNGLPLAVSTRVDKTAIIDASATDRGNGGHVNVISDITNPSAVTAVHGTLLANGGDNGGNGGMIETSGTRLDTSGIVVHARAPKGKAGQWLLDPTMIEITTAAKISAGSLAPIAGSLTTAGTRTISDAGKSYVDAATIDTALNNGTNVTVRTLGLTNGGAFDVWVLAPIQKTGGAATTLTLQAANSVYVGSPISSTSGVLNVKLWAGNDASSGLTGHGAVLLAANITTNGGSIDFGTNVKVNGVLVGGDVYVNSQLNPVGSTSTNQLITLDTSAASSAGNVNIYGQTVIANPKGFTINTKHTGTSTTATDGNVLFAGTVDSGNSFQYVSASDTWNAALTAAASGTGTKVGDTYLATIPTSLINAVASFTTNYTSAWLGGERLVASTVTGTPKLTDTATLDNKWYWVTGPLGLVVNTNSPTGYGTAFFTQKGTVNSNGLGGSAIGTAYTNWNPATPEPNNSNGASMTPAGASEWVMQFVGTQGQWNDLNPIATNGTSANQMGYVKETNFAASPLTVNSGTGTITLKAGVGGNAPLMSFNATGKDIRLPQTPTINTNNGTTFNGQVWVYNAGSSAYVKTDLLTISAVSQSETYGAIPPTTLPISYKKQTGLTQSTPPKNVNAATSTWTTTPTLKSDIGIYQASVSGATWAGGGSNNPYTILYNKGALTINPAQVSVSGLSATSRAYNGTTTIGLTGTAALTGLLNGDIGAFSGSSTTGTVASADVQSLNGVPQAQAVTTGSSFTLSTGKLADYTFVQPSLSAIISPAPVTVSGLTPTNRNYDGTKNVALVALNGTPLRGLVSGQSLTISNLATGGVASSANVGTNAVTAQLQLANASSGTGNASNYVLSTQPTLNAVTISKADITVTGLTTPVNRNYDGPKNVALNGSPLLSGLVSGQSLTIGNLATGGLASSANVGTNAVTAQLQLGNATSGTGSASNYVLNQPALSSITINPAPVTVSGLAPVNRKYDDTTNVALNGTPLLSGLVSGQSLTIGNLATGGLASSANVGTNTVTAQLQLGKATSGTGSASNYVLSQPSLGSVTINPVPVTITGLAPVNRKYDGTTNVALNGTPVWSGLIGTQSLTIGNLATGGLASSANVGTNAVTAQIQLANASSGTGNASNYVLSTQPTLNAVTISKAAVTVNPNPVTVNPAPVTIGPAPVTTVFPPYLKVVIPIQSGIPALAVNSGAVSITSLTMPPVVINDETGSAMSITVMKGGVFASNLVLPQNGFSQILTSLKIRQLIDRFSNDDLLTPSTDSSSQKSGL